jgi:putative membrane protein
VEERFDMSYLDDPRVLFAAERTLLAWNRTSLAMIAFGFVVERAGLLIAVLQGHQAPHTTSSTFMLGLAFILLGAVCALISSYQYGVVLKQLSEAEIPKGYKARWGILANLVVAVLSLALAVSLFNVAS